MKPDRTPRHPPNTSPASASQPDSLLVGPVMPVPDVCLHQLFEQHAHSFPERPAVIDNHGPVSYAELNRRANAIAHHLLGLGIGREDRVAVLMHRSSQHVAALIGILKCGAVYVPLDPRAPAERLRLMLGDSGGRVVLCGVPAGLGAPLGNVQLVTLGRPLEESESEPDIQVAPGNVAYLFYTSGSTGRPKAVEVEHRGVVNEVIWTKAEYGLNPEDRASWLASPAFAVSRWELWPYLACGATIHIADDETVALSSRLQHWLITNRVTVAFIVTSLAEALWELDWPPETALRLMATGGEKVNRWPPEDLPFHVLVAYGITETSGVRVVHRIEASTRQRSGSPPIGLPIANTIAYVLDEHLLPRPAGTAGELVLGGFGLARGYPKQPSVTAERFIPDPFGSEAGARAYRTGDVVRLSDDGYLEFVGRTDDQVKLNGIRVELGEVEAALREQPGIEAGIVALRDHPKGHPALVAYVVLEPNHELNINQLRGGMARKLPWHMLPSALVQLQALPLGLNGKVDRKQLPAPAWPQAHRNGPPPATPLARTIASTMAAVLAIPEPGLHDDFLVLGGNSLKAAQLAGLLEEKLGRHVPIDWVFEHRTTAALEVCLQAVEMGEADKDNERRGIDEVQKMLDGMTDAEVEVLLGSMLSDGSTGE